MATNSWLKHLFEIEQISFIITNRLPRRLATIFMGWFSKLENPVISWLTIKTWQLFSDELDLSEAKSDEFRSLHECFIRELRPGSRSIDPDPETITSPCDGIVGAFGQIQDMRLFQIKGSPYKLSDLLCERELVERYRNGIYITLRLKSTMYHRFHAPCNCRINRVNYISGDTWNVNPVTLRRIERLYCRNERAVIDLSLDDSDKHLTLVPVAAILVAGIKLHCLPDVLDLKYRGPNHITCDAEYKKGEELGYFQHGSTIILFANRGFTINASIKEGEIIRMGQPLLISQPLNQLKNKI